MVIGQVLLSHVEGGLFWYLTYHGWSAGDKLPLGAPALMMSPQQEEPGRIPKEMVRQRDAKYDLSSSGRVENRANIVGPLALNPLADRWRTTGKGWAVDFKEVAMPPRA